MKLSVVIPAHNEVDSVADTVTRTVDELLKFDIDHEIVVIDDASTDGTVEVLQDCSSKYPTVRWATSHLPPGFGHAVRAGLDLYTGTRSRS